MKKKKKNKTYITMAYNQFWDTFNWELYQRIILIKLKYDR